MNNKKIILNLLQSLHPEINFENELRHFVSSGILESFDIVQIISELETLLGIKIPGTELVPENFESLDAICSLATKYQGTQS